MKEEIFEAALADKARLKEVRGETQPGKPMERFRPGSLASVRKGLIRTGCGS